ncbi:MAG: hypothetical protein AAB473_00770 [Patescibacteria group bacterium]
MKRNTLGIILLAAPIPLIVLTLSVYAITSFVLASSISAGGDSGALLVAGKAFNVLLGLVGLIAVVGVPVGMPIGIYLLCTPDKGKK